MHAEERIRTGANTGRPRLLLIELNEFNPDFLVAQARRLGLASIQKCLAWPRATTLASDSKEHHGLDPWVQWINVHSGAESSEHGIRRLGDTRRQVRPQLWHALARKGFSWGAWGVMNAPLGEEAGCRFFMPDPWSFEESARPAPLNDLLALPRYVSKNYLHVAPLPALTNAGRLLRFFLRPQNWGLGMRFAARALPAMFAAGINVHTFTTLLDYLSVLCVVQMRARERPDFTVIFLNHIAHLQHQFWVAGEQLHPQMELGLRLCDAMLGLLLEDREPGEAMVVMNGFRQHNIASQGVFVYRQINPQAAVEALGVTGGRVEQAMTHDAHIMFDADADAERALAIFSQCRMRDGSPLFHAERAGPKRIFYQLEFEGRVSPDERFRVGEREIAFASLFELVCERTGAHLSEGDLYANGIVFPGTFPNQKVFDYVLAHFDPSKLASAA